MDAEIRLRYESTTFARSVMNALTPDNKLESGRMKIKSNVTGKRLKVNLKDCDRIETLSATLQDIFRCIRAAESSLNKLATYE